MALDSGMCTPESISTLRLQQTQLVAGKRVAQMFPAGTPELPLPAGYARHQNARGVFHFDAWRTSAASIDALSAGGRENEILNLGPFSKMDVAQRVRSGEALTCITEYTPDGVELRSAAGTDGTIPEQMAYFDATKEPESRIVVGEFPARVVNNYQMRR